MDLSYNSNTGAISFTERTDTQVNSLADARVATATGANLDLSHVSTTNLPEGTNLYYTNGRFDTQLATKTTTNLAEGTNKYFTNDRVRQAISVSGDLSYNSNTGAISFTERTDAQVNSLADARVATTGANLDLQVSTTNLPEGTNLYYTNGRFDTQLATKTTTNLAEGTNKYYTNGRFDTQLATKTTTNLAEGTNKYFTNDRARQAISVSGDLSITQILVLYHSLKEQTHKSIV